MNNIKKFYFRIMFYIHVTCFINFCFKKVSFCVNFDFIGSIRLAYSI